MATNRNNGFTIETLAQYGSPIGTYKETEHVVVQHVRVNGREQVEVKVTWANPAKGTGGDVWMTNNFGRKTKFAINLDSQEALDDLISALETVRLDFKESPKVDRQATQEVPVVTVKPVVGRTAEAKRRAAARTKKAS